MTKISETIVFFGSGPVAAKSLDLLSTYFNIEAVVTKPAKNTKRDPVPVLDLANKLNINTYLPTNKAELNKLITEWSVKSKLAVLIDYGIIVSQEVIDYFPLGIVNSHFSLLPLWRGADPISFSILNGDKETGVSLMLLTAGMDEGPIIKQEALKDSFGLDSIELTDRLVSLSNQLLEENIQKYIDKDLLPTEQDTTIKPTYSTKLSKTDGLINWNKPAIQIEREIRAYLEWPKSYTTLNNIDLIITKAKVIDRQGKPGKFEVDGSSLIVFCGEAALSIEKIKPSGKKEMDIKPFLLGYHLN